MGINEIISITLSNLNTIGTKKTIIELIKAEELENNKQLKESYRLLKKLLLKSTKLKLSDLEKLAL